MQKQLDTSCSNKSMINKQKKYIDRYLKEVRVIIELIDREKIVEIIEVLEKIKEKKGRLFILGIGGSSANASHAVNDFRKICGIESYTPTDNVAELTAWTNDNGFEYIFIKWLQCSHFNKNDALIILSVGGGSQTTSQNLVLAMRYAKKLGAKIVGVVSRDGGETKKLADACVIIPPLVHERITPHAEEWQGIILHLIANALVS